MEQTDLYLVKSENDNINIPVYRIGKVVKVVSQYTVKNNNPITNPITFAHLQIILYNDSSPVLGPNDDPILVGPSGTDDIMCAIWRKTNWVATDKHMLQVLQELSK